MTELELMEAAIAQARKSLSEGGIPIGSALARNGELLAVGHKRSQALKKAAILISDFGFRGRLCN